MSVELLVGRDPASTAPRQQHAVPRLLSEEGPELGPRRGVLEACISMATVSLVLCAAGVAFTKHRRRRSLQNSLDLSARPDGAQAGEASSAKSVDVRFQPWHLWTLGEANTTDELPADTSKGCQQAPDLDREEAAEPAASETPEASVKRLELQRLIFDKFWAHDSLMDDLPEVHPSWQDVVFLPEPAPGIPPRSPRRRRSTSTRRKRKGAGDDAPPADDAPERPRPSRRPTFFAGPAPALPRAHAEKQGAMRAARALASSWRQKASVMGAAQRRSLGSSSWRQRVAPVSAFAPSLSQLQLATKAAQPGRQPRTRGSSKSSAGTVGEGGAARAAQKLEEEPESDLLVPVPQDPSSKLTSALRGTVGFLSHKLSSGAAAAHFDGPLEDLEADELPCSQASVVPDIMRCDEVEQSPRAMERSPWPGQRAQPRA